MDQSKRRRTNVADAADACPTAANPQENPPPYLKLIADCWENIFDYLSFKDILVMGQTCKRMNRMAGYYVREYYPDLKFFLTENDIRLSSYPNHYVQSDFFPYVGRLHIHGSLRDSTFFANTNSFESLKALCFEVYELNEMMFEQMLNVLKNIETIELMPLNFSGKCFEQFAIYCPKLKNMKIKWCDVTDFETLFLQSYPSLEKLCWLPKKSDTRIDQLKTHLKKHSKLKQLEIDWEFLWANRDLLVKTHIRLDLLIIHFNTCSADIEFDEFAAIIKILYAQNFYKTLKLVCEQCNRIDYLSDDISALPGLEYVYFYSYFVIDLTRLVNIKVLHIESCPLVTHVKTLVKSLTKLEELIFVWAKFDVISSFVRLSKSLKTIRFSDIEDRGILNVDALNQERMKLAKACLVTIYVPDHIYLPAKWKSKNLDSNFVEIKRLHSSSLD